MKTKLLLFFLWAFSFANAQFNISEGFESGLAPAGWTSQGGITTTPVVALYIRLVIFLTVIQLPHLLNLEQILLQVP